MILLIIPMLIRAVYGEVVFLRNKERDPLLHLFNVAPAVLGLFSYWSMYIITTHVAYSCVEDGLVRLLHGNTMTYIAGWESDACVLGTCFDLFDKGVPFRIVTDCIASERQNAHEAALVIMNRNFGKVTLIKSEEV